MKYCVANIDLYREPIPCTIGLRSMKPKHVIIILNKLNGTNQTIECLTDVNFVAIITYRDIGLKRIAFISL